MSASKKSIAIVGAGIVGASIAYALSRRGIGVHLFDEGPRPARGVTGKAFGWINLINGEPLANPASYGLRKEAVEEYRRLKAFLPNALRDAQPGSLVWRKTVEETEALVQAHRSQGAPVDLVDAAAIARWEPHLRSVPPCAAFSRDDLALDPGRLTEALVRAAVTAGATTSFGRKVTFIETSNGRATAVRTPDGAVPADVVVLAAGTATGTLASALGEDVGIESSPAILLRYSAPHPFLGRILCGPDLEIRQSSDNSLWVATRYIDGSDGNAHATVGSCMLDIMRRHLILPEGVELLQAEVGRRPMFSDGLPRLGFLRKVGGVYVAAGHPGVILAPLLGRLAAEELIDGRRSPLVSAAAPAG